MCVCVCVCVYGRGREVEIGCVVVSVRMCAVARGARLCVCHVSHDFSRFKKALVRSSAPLVRSSAPDTSPGH